MPTTKTNSPKRVSADESELKNAKSSRQKDWLGICDRAIVIDADNLAIDDAYILQEI